MYAVNTHPTVLSRLVPLTAVESTFVLDHGWERFEREVLKQDPDLGDWTRSPMVFDCASR